MGMTSVVVPTRNSFVEATKIGLGDRLFTDGEAERSRQIEDNGSRDAGENQMIRRMRPNHAIEDADDVRVRSFSDDAVADHDRLDRAALGGRLPGHHVRQELDRLDVAPQPADVRNGDAEAPRALISSAGENRFTVAYTVGATEDGGNWCVRGATPRVIST